jgi:hypothetical protein
VALIGLFLGGWVTSQLAVGENKLEAAIYGVILWGVLFAVLLWLAVSGVQMGLSGMLGVASLYDTGAVPRDVPATVLQQAGVDPENISKTQEAIRNFYTSPEARARAHDVTTDAAWWTFFGILVSMIASIGGALVGAGPSFTIRRVMVRPVPTITRA